MNRQSMVSSSASFLQNASPMCLNPNIEGTEVTCGPYNNFVPDLPAENVNVEAITALFE